MTKPQWRKFKLNIRMTFSMLSYTCRECYKIRPRIVNYMKKNNCSRYYIFNVKAHKSGYDGQLFNVYDYSTICFAGKLEKFDE